MRGTSSLAPTLLIAKKSGDENSDFVFLDLTRAGFDLSDRGVTGRTPPGPTDVYTYLDRGIYRPGETINSVSMVRNNKVEALTSLPTTHILWRPDGVEAQRIVSTQSKLGSHVVSFALPENAMRGTWRLAVHTDPNGLPVREKEFLVEDFRPDRIEFDLSSTATEITREKPAPVIIDGRYLYGAPAADLKIEGEIRLKAVQTRKEAPGFLFGLHDEAIAGQNVVTLENLPLTDKEGQAEVFASLPSDFDSSKPVQADVVIRMNENGGRAVERTLSLPVKSQKAMIGIKPDFSDGQIAEGSVAGFTAIALDANGQKMAMGSVNWSLFRLERNFQWYKDGGGWRYEAIEIPSLVESGTLEIAIDGSTQLQAKVNWGRYRLELESGEPGGPISSMAFEAGWYVDISSTQTPDALEIALDKPSYKAGDIAKLKVTSKFSGEILLVVGTETVQNASRISVSAPGKEVEIPVSSDWGAGAYVSATIIRPGKAAANRLPARAIGTTWLKIEPEDRELSVKLGVPKQIQPNQSLEIPVEVSGLQTGEEAYLTLAMVDVGILNLTGYTAPNPVDWYFSQREMGLELRDLYGALIDSSQGGLGRIRSGGDGPGLTAQGSPPTEKLLSQFTGPIRLDANGKAEVSFDVPQFNGTAKVMAVVWTKRAVGQASSEIIIRDPVVISASMPKVMAPGDEATLVIELHNADLDTGDYQLSYAADDLVKISGVPDTVNLVKGKKKILPVNITALHPGKGVLELFVMQQGDSVARISQVLNIRPAELPLTTKLEFPLAANGGKFELDKELLATDFIQNANINVTITKHPALDVSSLLLRLDRYPYGCAEQTTSRALPLLYLSDFNAPNMGAVSEDIPQRIQKAIDRVLTFQSASGSFGLWTPDSGEFWLDSYITDFLTRAREKGYKVREQAMRLAVQNLQNQLGYQDNIAEYGDEIAYALYVLARNKMASASDLRYYADTKLEAFSSPLARSHLAAALSLYNEIDRTKSAFSSAIRLASAPKKIDWSNGNFGSDLRNNAAMLALASETGAEPALTNRMLGLLNREMQNRKYTSTQENAWMLLAARAVQEADKTISLDVNGESASGSFSRRLSGEDLASDALAVTNQTKQPLVVTVTKSASPKSPGPAGGNGFSIERKYYQLDGTQTDLNNVLQNQRFVVVLSVSKLNGDQSRIIVSDLLPGGFEIDNPSLVKSAELENFDWIGETEVAHTEFRDDRFIAAMNRRDGEPQNFQLAYVVRAVTPGKFSHPAASVEDMYRPQLQARTASGFLQVNPAN